MCKIYSKSFLKISIKPLRNLFPEMLQTFVTRRAVKEHLGTPKTLYGQLKGCLDTQGTQAFEHLRQSGAWRALEHSDTQSTALRYLGTWRVLGHSSLRYSGTLALETIEVLYLVTSFNGCPSYSFDRDFNTPLGLVSLSSTLNRFLQILPFRESLLLTFSMLLSARFISK